MKENDSKPDALALAFKLLGLRSHSRDELEQKLTRKGCEPSGIVRAMERLTELGVLNDRAFAMEVISSRSRRKPSGMPAMRYLLRKKGVNDSVADELLRDYDSSELCLQAAAKKILVLRGKSAEERKRKLERFLHSRGFEWQEIQKALKLLPQVGAEGEESEA
ncbi:MAG: recombination regulator RecX [Chlorobiaceae bacterium]